MVMDGSSMSPLCMISRSLTRLTRWTSMHSCSSLAPGVVSSCTWQKFCASDICSVLHRQRFRHFPAHGRDFGLHTSAVCFTANALDIFLYMATCVLQDADALGWTASAKPTGSKHGQRLRWGSPVILLCELVGRITLQGVVPGTIRTAETSHGFTLAHSKGLSSPASGAKISHEQVKAISECDHSHDGLMHRKGAHPLLSALPQLWDVFYSDRQFWRQVLGQ